MTRKKWVSIWVSPDVKKELQNEKMTRGEYWDDLLMRILKRYREVETDEK
jgi:hypothetical protein